MSGSRVILKDKKLIARLKRLTRKRAKVAFTAGVATGGMALMFDSVATEPTTPFRTGALRGSASLHVQNKLQATGTQIGNYPTVSVPTEAGIPIQAHTFVAVVGFNMPYAHLWHENEPAGWETRRSTPFHEPSAGMKYMANKLDRFADKYGRIMVSKIRSELAA